MHESAAAHDASCGTAKTEPDHATERSPATDDPLADVLVAAIVPAYNASRTIDETLRSIRSQTHTRLEILVVDDGSTDDTAAAVARHAALDPRVRLIRQSNAGVANARNRGIDEATAEFVAPIDADDLWAPTKIAEQLAVMRAGGPRVGLVYGWFVEVDRDGIIRSQPSRHAAQGDVVRELCRRNLIGNGSGALIRRQAVIEAGGYDSGLRAAGAEGCEDIALYLKVAESYHFGVVRKVLTGYRQVPDSMSHDGYKMYRSWSIVAKDAARRLPHCRPELDAFSHWFVQWAMHRERQAGRYLPVAALAARHPRLAASKIRAAIGRLVRGIGARAAQTPAGPAVPTFGRFPVGTPPAAIPPDPNASA